MAVLTVHPISRAGDSKVYVAADAGLTETCPNDGRTFLHVKNTNASTRDCTVESVRPCDQGFDHNIVVTVGATTGDEMIGPFPPDRFGSTLAITWTASAGVTVAALSLPSN